MKDQINMGNIPEGWDENDKGPESIGPMILDKSDGEVDDWLEPNGKYQDANKQWFGSGKGGCTFAALFAKNPQSVNWITVDYQQFNRNNCKDAALISIQFPEHTKDEVRDWAACNGFYEEEVADGLQGLRFNCPEGIAWVQYFGPDAHVATRKAPIPELCMAVKLTGIQYAKVGFSGILHLAHASVDGIAQKAADILWDSSHKNTEKRIGHKPGIEQAAKTTYKDK